MTLIAELRDIAAAAEACLQQLHHRNWQREFRQKRTKVEVRHDAFFRRLKKGTPAPDERPTISGLASRMHYLRDCAVSTLAQQRKKRDDWLAVFRETARVFEQCITYDSALLDPYQDEGQANDATCHALTKALKYCALHANALILDLSKLPHWSFHDYDISMGFHVTRRRDQLKNIIGYRFVKMREWTRGFTQYECVRKCFRAAINALYQAGQGYCHIKAQHDARTRERARQFEFEEGSRQHAFDEGAFKVMEDVMRQMGFSEEQVASAMRTWRMEHSPSPDLPNDALGLRKIIQTNHPDKNQGADLRLFQRAKAKLDTLRSSRKAI